MGNLLLDDRPLVIQPKLIELLGDPTEAIILQQIHYWLVKNMNIKDGYSWVYNSIKDWNKQFKWLSEPTLKRKFKSLEDKGLLITGNYNKAKFDRTKWYRIDYDALDEMVQALYQNDTTIVSKRYNAKYQNDTDYTIDYTKNNNIDNTTTGPTEIGSIYEFWESNVGSLSPYMYEEIQAIYDDWKEVSKQPKEMILESIKMALDKGVRNISYIKTILKRWYDNRIYNIEDLKADQERFEKSKQRKSNKNKKKSMFMDAKDQDHSKSDEEAWEAFWNG